MIKRPTIEHHAGHCWCSTCITSIVPGNQITGKINFDWRRFREGKLSWYITHDLIGNSPALGASSVVWKNWIVLKMHDILETDNYFEPGSIIEQIIRQESLLGEKNIASFFKSMWILTCFFICTFCTSRMA